MSFIVRIEQFCCIMSLTLIHGFAYTAHLILFFLKSLNKGVCCTLHGWFCFLTKLDCNLSLCNGKYEINGNISELWYNSLHFGVTWVYHSFIFRGGSYYRRPLLLQPHAFSPKPCPPKTCAYSKWPLDGTHTPVHNMINL